MYSKKIELENCKFSAIELETVLKDVDTEAVKQQIVEDIRRILSPKRFALVDKAMGLTAEQVDYDILIQEFGYGNADAFTKRMKEAVRSRIVERNLDMWRFLTRKP